MATRFEKLYKSYLESKAKHEADKAKLLNAVNIELKKALSFQLEEKNLPSLELTSEGLIVNYREMNYDDFEQKQYLLK